jgi:glycerate-2-kinase
MVIGRLSDGVLRGVDRVAGSDDAGRADRALGVLARLGLADRYPTVVRAIRRAWREESGPTHPIEHRLIGSNATAVEAAAERLRATGHRRVETRLGVIGEACEVGRAIGQCVKEMAAARGRGDHDGPSAVVWGGETTVTVGHARGRGGPCQEAVLAAAVALDGASGRVLALATDGRDGPTDAAGAWADGSTVSAAFRFGVDLSSALETHDSFSACGRLGVLIETGRTGTNVNDVLVGVVSPGG